MFKKSFIQNIALVFISTFLALFIINAGLEIHFLSKNKIAENLKREMIKRGVVDLAIAGGSEAAICPIAIAGFASCKALSMNNENPLKASRPFDLHRDGFVLGEGAAVLLIEDLEHAKKRGANILA